MRARLEMQGFEGLSDAAIRDVVYWLRAVPFLCAVWTAAATLAESAAALWALVPLTAIGALLPRHPCDVVHAVTVRRWRSSVPLPRYRAPRRFAAMAASIWLTLAGAAFASGWIVAGRVSAWLFVGVAAVHACTGFCAPSWVYRRVARARVSSP
jgi:hypothetical protein